MSEERLPEKAGVPNGIVAIAMASAFGIVGVAAATVFVFYPSARVAEPPELSVFPAPVLEIEPVRDYARYAADARAALEGAGGRMPIGEAMARIAARGEEAYAPLPRSEGPQR